VLAGATICGVITAKSAPEGDMQTPIVTEILRETTDAQRASHLTQVERVRQSLLRGGEADPKRA
jgi:hypothetical protein